MMPRMSGYELTRIIRKRFTISELPILLLTARNRPEDIENGFLAGANDYVTKPVDAVELKSRVNALTEVRKSSRERLRMESAWLHDRRSTRLNSSHVAISYAVACLIKTNRHHL